MDNIKQFKKTRSLNYKCSFVAMILCQIILFSMRLEFWVNVITYIINLIGWIVVGALLECFLAIKHGIDLSQLKKNKKNKK